MRLLSRLALWLVIFALLYCLGWFGAAWVVRSKVAEVLSQLDQRGITAEVGKVTVEGFPRRFLIHVQGARAVRRADSLTWVGPETLVAGIDLLRPLTGMVDISGVHQLVRQGLPMTINVDSQRIAASIHPLNRSLLQVDLNLPAVTLSSPGVGELTVRGIDAALEPARDSQIPFHLSIAAIEPPQPLAAIAQPTDISLRGQIFPQLPGGLDRQRVERWQQDNGLITISELTGQSESLSWNGEGQLWISPDLQPNANLNMRVKGIDPFMQKLVDLGLIDQSRVSLAKIALALFTRPAKDGEGTEVVAPLNVRNGNLVLGPIELLELPKINWPR